MTAPSTISVDNSFNDESLQGPVSTLSDSPLTFCTVCASNQNRSMEAHLILALSAIPTISFGTGSMVRLPGPSLNEPNTYAFNALSYNDMFEELKAKDQRLYTANGLLNMLNRNRQIKRSPEAWKSWRVGERRDPDLQRAFRGGEVEEGVVDVVITCEERCWDAVVEDLMGRGGNLNRPVHVINVDIRDNHEEAVVGGKAILRLAQMLCQVTSEERALMDSDPDQAESMNDELDRERRVKGSIDGLIPGVLAEWQEDFPNLPTLYTVTYF